VLERLKLRSREWTLARIDSCMDESSDTGNALQQSNRRVATTATALAIVTGLVLVVVMPWREIHPSTVTAASLCRFESTPSVAPRLPADVQVGEQADFNCFAWQEFIALNWRASLTRAGQPNPAAKASQFGEPSSNPAPVVWETYMDPSLLYRRDASTPKPWGSIEPAPKICKSARLALPTLPRRSYPIGAHVLVMSGEVTQFSQRILRDFIHAGANGAWLTAQNGTLVRYEERFNEDEYNYVVQNRFYDARNQWKAMQTGGPGLNLPDGGPDSRRYGPVGAIEIKAAWVEMDDPNLWPKFFMTYAYVVDYTRHPPTCKVAHLGLIGLHIIHKTQNAQQFAWATFEHVSNDPDLTATPAPSATFTLYNSRCNRATDHYQCRANTRPIPCSGSTLPVTCDPYSAPIQVMRVKPIPPIVVSLNNVVWKEIRQNNRNSVFQYYQLVNVLWPKANVRITPGARVPLTQGDAVPAKAQGGLANTTMETYFQGPEQRTMKTCLDCHSYAEIAAQPTTNSTPEPNVAADYSFLLGHAKFPAALARATTTPTAAPRVTVVPLPVAAPVPGAQTPSTAAPGSGLTVILAFLVVLIGIVLVANVLVQRRLQSPFFKPGFVEAGYVPWFLLHYDIAAVALILIVILGLTGTINAEVISGLFAGVVGYVLGNVGRRTADGAHDGGRGGPRVTTPSPLPNGQVNGSYAQSLSATSGTTPYTWSIGGSGNPLPAGLQLDSDTGLLHGKPTTVGKYDFTVLVTDGTHAVGAKVFQLIIDP